MSWVPFGACKTEVCVHDAFLTCGFSLFSFCLLSSPLSPLSALMALFFSFSRFPLFFMDGASWRCLLALLIKSSAQHPLVCENAPAMPGETRAGWTGAGLWSCHSGIAKLN